MPKIFLNVEPDQVSSRGCRVPGDKPVDADDDGVACHVPAVEHRGTSEFFIECAIPLIPSLIECNHSIFTVI